MLKVPVSAADHVQGPDQAAVTLVEYGDYQCPYCGRAYPVVKRIQQQFGDSLRFAFRNFPLSEMHLHAESAAETAEFAGERGKFWAMHDLLFENQERLGGPLYLELVEGLQLPAPDLIAALKERAFLARVREDFSGGVRSGVEGTPTFFVNGRRLEGAADFATLRAAIDAQERKP